MAVEHGIWKVGDTPQLLCNSIIDSEKLLEDQIRKDISILNENWMLIGQQVYTDFNKYIDLLAVDAEGKVIIIELKKDKTSREVVAQILDYASWVMDLDATRLSEIYLKYINQNVSLSNAFEAKFGNELSEESLNQNHSMVIVSSELDASSERIINYLNKYTTLNINVMFFKVFEDNNSKYISRSWLIDPQESEERAISKTNQLPWNNEFYCSFGYEEDGRSLDDAKKYGFISAGGGSWYTNTLNLLNEGNRVWVNIPKKGYIGFAEVIGPKTSIDDFSKDKELEGKYLTCLENGEDNAEYVVPVKWIYLADNPVKELGFFGNQNTIAKPVTPKWEYTVQRLKKIWDIRD